MLQWQPYKTTYFSPFSSFEVSEFFIFMNIQVIHEYPAIIYVKYSRVQRKPPMKKMKERSEYNLDCFLLTARGWGWEVYSDSTEAHATEGEEEKEDPNWGWGRSQFSPLVYGFQYIMKLRPKGGICNWNKWATLEAIV